MTLQQMSVSGAVIIVVIVIIRALAIHKLPKRAFLALWGVAAARLLIPYRLPSAWSVYSLLELLSPAKGTAADVPAVAFTPMIAPANQITPLPVPVTETAAASLDPWVAVWLAGALACAAYFAVAYFKCRREFETSLPVDTGYAKLWLGEYRIRRAIEIRQSDRISAPLTYGVFHPVILMPKTADWEDIEAINYVLAHEYVHIRRFDAVRKLILTAALCVHWFNPAVWIMYVLANRDIELSCDEAVIRRFGEGTKSAYAMTLIRMEEARSGFAPLCNNFSKNAIEERIIAIMKIKKTSLFSLIAAASLIVGVTAGFATNAKAEGENIADDIATGTVRQVTTVTSYVNPEDGKTYYSFDGGITFEAMTDEEYNAHFSSVDVEWWTYDEYKEWLENEKIVLQDMIGERAWTSGRGEFVWTQEIVDETVAMYEEILEEIKNGMLYSKTIDGQEDTSLMLSMNPADMWLNAREAPASEADFSEYAPFGLKWDGKEKILYWNGERVRYFFDGAELEGTGGRAIHLEYADAKLGGKIDVYAVRERIENPDGSFDPFGPLVGLEKYSQAEFDARTFDVPSLEVESSTAQSAETTYTLVLEREKAAEFLKKLVPFGLSYDIDPDTGAPVNLRWQGKTVHSVYAPEEGHWITDTTLNDYITPDMIVLELVYENGKLTGLREWDAKAIVTSFNPGADAEQGTSFAERFETYAPFGITYKEAKHASGRGNVYLNGKLVNRFIDIAPDGSVFSFTSSKQGGNTAITVYDDSGKLTGIEIILDAQK